MKSSKIIYVGDFKIPLGDLGGIDNNQGFEISFFL